MTELPKPPLWQALREIAWVFLKLGVTGFGGPAAHIAMMEAEMVRRRAWLPREEFMDLLGATNLIPGPNSTELAIHLGHRRGGWWGLLLAGFCFILPATLIVMAIAWAYVRWGSLPESSHLLAGIQPVILAVVLQALWGMGQSALKKRLMATLAGLAFLLSLAGAPELALLGGAGAVAALARWRELGGKPPAALSAWLTLGPLGALAPAPALAAAPFGLWPMFGFFLKVGSVLFGSGYVLLAFLRADLVVRFGWLTDAQLLDAITVGQITPGPVFTTATFIGYLLGGPVGAIVATVGIFMPAFFFVAISGPLIPKIRRSPLAGAALDGIVAASLALMAAVSVQLGQTVLTSATSIALTLLCTFMLVRWKPNASWLILAGALLGLGQGLGWP